MRTTSATWDALHESDTGILETKAVINGAEYTDISAPVITRAAMQDAMSVGNVISASCVFAIRTTDAIPKAAKVEIYSRYNDEETQSEWLTMGTFYISKRQRDPVSGVLALECYDGLLKSNSAMMEDVPWTDENGEAITDENDNPIMFTAFYPRDMASVTNDIAIMLGMAIDERTTIGTGELYMVPVPSASATIRDMLSFIGAANAGNWIVTPENKLRLVPVVSSANADSATTDVAEVTAVVGGLQVGDERTVTGVQYTYGDEAIPVLIGDATGFVMNVTLPYAQANALSQIVIGMTYRPYTFTNCRYNPAAEIGDYIRYGETAAGVLWSEVDTYNVVMSADASAPDFGEIEDEYPYVGMGQKTLIDAKAYALEKAQEATAALDDSLQQEEIFNRLTNNGEEQGIYLSDGKLYINGTFMQIGTIRGANGENYWILDGENPIIVAQRGYIGQFTLENGKLSYTSATGAYTIDISKSGIRSVFYNDDTDNTNTTRIYGGRIEFYWNDTNTFDISNGDEYLYVRNNVGETDYPVQIYNSAGVLGKRIDVAYDVHARENLTVYGDFSVSGTKNRSVHTDQYADRLLYCYETPTPYFGDIGEGIIGDDGLCYVAIDPVFAETVNTNNYQVFLQRYGEGDCYVKERKAGWFVVAGTPGLLFGWELKAKQCDYDQRRLDRNDQQFIPPVQTYGEDAAAYITDLKKARISA